MKALTKIPAALAVAVLAVLTLACQKEQISVRYPFKMAVEGWLPDTLKLFQPYRMLLFLNTDDLERPGQYGISIDNNRAGMVELSDGRQLVPLRYEPIPLGGCPMTYTPLKAGNQFLKFTGVDATGRTLTDTLRLNFFVRY